MEKHVSHLLDAYVNRQLEADTSRRVYLHLMQCTACRERLAIVEQIEFDLDRTFRVEVGPSRIEKKVWWRQIQLRKSYSRHFRSAALLPAAVCVLVLILPFAVQRDVQDQLFISPVAVPQAFTTEVASSFRAATEPLNQSAVMTRVSFVVNPANTPQPLSTTMPPVPAPLAPARP